VRKVPISGKSDRPFNTLTRLGGDLLTARGIDATGLAILPRSLVAARSYFRAACPIGNICNPLRLQSAWAPAPARGSPAPPASAAAPDSFIDETGRCG
jgi:hypothetical protein